MSINWGMHAGVWNTFCVYISMCKYGTGSKQINSDIQIPYTRESNYATQQVKQEG